MGWYVGFKLHLLCNEKGELIDFVLTRANVDDRNEAVIDTLTDRVFGKLYADKGYISQSLFGHLWDDGIHIVTGLRSNMKQRLMPFYDRMMLRKRSIIESINDMLKNVAQLVHSRHRSVHNFLMNLLGGKGGCFFSPPKPKEDFAFVLGRQRGGLLAGEKKKKKKKKKRSLETPYSLFFLCLKKKDIIFFVNTYGLHIIF